jgi:hypothetical protein
MTHPDRQKLLRDLDRSEALRAEIKRYMDDETYDLQAKWEELEKLDLDIHRQIKVLFLKKKQAD